MSDYDDGYRGAAQASVPTQQQLPAYPAYGYGLPPYGIRPRRMYPIETKPFFLTSEFAVSLITAIAIAITAASSHAFGAWRAWILIAGIVASYNISRGIAKSGTRSNASDPRENFELNWGRGNDHQDAHQQ
ncbi:MAG TPA: hypothetical protein VGO39_05585 [Gaiellaceae bacterium]|nr:hypothetical protein [Gaiellaceae bacterium]